MAKEAEPMTDTHFWTPAPKSDLFDNLAAYKFILVTGPQRAGTTIASVMIANDLGYERLDETAVWGFMDVRLPDPPYPIHWQRFFAEYPGPCVIHCPEHCAYVHLYAGIGNVAIVLVRRDVADILASQKRVGWGFEFREMMHYPGYGRPIATAKYHFWDTVQLGKLGRQAFEIDYESLSAHPMWVPKEERANFTIAQVEVGKPRGNRIQNPDIASMPLEKLAGKDD